MTMEAAPAERYRELFSSAPCGLLTATADGTVTEVNDTLLEWMGRDRGEVIGTRFIDHLDPGSQLFFETRHTPVLRLQGEVREVSLTLLCADGSRRPVLVSSVLRDVDGVPEVRSAVFDATERREYERELIEAKRSAESSESRVRVLQAASSAFTQSATEVEVCEALESSVRQAFAPRAVGVFRLDDDGSFQIMAGTNPLEGLIQPSSPRASDAALETETTIVVRADDVDSRYAAVAAALRSQRLESVSVIPLVRNSVPIGVLACFFSRTPEFDDGFGDLQAALARLAAQSIVRLRLQQELERMALSDQLTGLPNRKVLRETVAAAIVDARDAATPLAVLFLDLDGFKRINDELGHAAGDAVLQEVATRLRAGVRHDDAVGRYGGDEFVAVCENADAEAAVAIAERIREAVRVPLEGFPDHLGVSASIGIALYVPELDAVPSSDQLLNLADGAMYLAKSEGKDRVAMLHD